MFFFCRSSQNSLSQICCSLDVANAHGVVNLSIKAPQKHTQWLHRQELFFFYFKPITCVHSPSDRRSHYSMKKALLITPCLVMALTWHGQCYLFISWSGLGHIFSTTTHQQAFCAQTCKEIDHPSTAKQSFPSCLWLIRNRGSLGKQLQVSNSMLLEGGAKPYV